MIGVYEPGPYRCEYSACRLSMPSTLALKFAVAMKDSSLGIRTEKTSREPFSVPIVNTENEAGWDVWYSASAAAIFIGW